MSMTVPAKAAKATKANKKVVATAGNTIGAVTMNADTLIHLPSASMALIV